MVHPKIMRYKDLDLLYQNAYNHLKIEIALNWFEITSLTVAIFLLILKVFLLLKIGNLSISIALTIIVSFTIIYLVVYLRKYQLKITRFDKEKMYKKICRKLIKKSKDLA
jgi:uncharacterized membrane protein YGL010W